MTAIGRPVLLALAAASALLTGCGGSSGLVVASLTSPATATIPSGVTTVPESSRGASTGPTRAGRTPAAVYLLRGARVSPVRRELSGAGGKAGVWAALVHALLRGPSAVERQTGTGTAFPRPGTAPYDFEDLSVNPSTGIASIDMPQSFGRGDIRGVRERLAQLVFTLTQSPAVTGVSVTVDGRALTTVAGLSAPPRPLDRNDFEAQTPPILIESPLPGDVPSCPVSVTGTANTFEGTFLIVPLDGSGQPLTSPRNVNATSGSGTRGTFDVQLLCPNGKLPGRIAAYEECVTGEGSCDPRRGANRVEIPLGVETR